MKAHLKTFPDRRNRSNLVAFLFLTVLFNCFYAKAQNVKNFNTSQPFLFEENKGQLLDESGNVLSDIKYYGKQGGVYVYCKTGMLSFVFTKSEKGPGQISEATGTTEDESVLSPAGGGRGWKNHEGPQTTKISSSRMDLVLLGSNLNTIITASDQQECYENYYTTGDADHGITNVHTYKTLTYKNIYPQIDMILSIAKKGMEYSFLVHPGGNVSDIKLRWNGADKEKALKNGGIKYANMLGIMQESAPKSFVDTKSIQSSFVRKGAQFSFKVENYDRNKDLIIDPTLVWGTYFGGNKADYGYGLATDDSGNVYLLGETTSKSGIASSGAYQTSLAGLGSIFLSKFNSLGNLIWSTYYGGKNNDGALSVAVDKSGNAYITGQASSSSGIATSGAYQTSIAANSSAAFLGKFGSNGQLKWSTYFGNGGEGEEITTDIYGNVIVSGAAYSYKISNSSMVTSGAYETSPGGGNSDAFLAKFSTNGALQWGTYYGGNGEDQTNGVTTDSSGNIYITGQTTSSSGIATSGAYQTSYLGNTSAFLAAFDSNGGRKWATYYGGGNQDIGSKIKSDRAGNVYIVGSTESSSGIATVGGFQTSYSGNTDAFLANFNSGGAIKWATYYGGGNQDIGVGITLDHTENIYISGCTLSTAGIATNGAYQTSFAAAAGDHEGSAFLAKFSKNGAINWSTYYGDSQDNVGNNVVADDSGNVYMAGYTLSSSRIATSGAYQTSYGGSEDAFLAKFNFYPPNDAGITSLQNPALTTCPGTYPIRVTLKNNGDNVLNYGTIAWTFNGTIQTSVSWTDTLNPNDSTIINLGTVNLWPGKSIIKAWPTTVNGKTNAGGYGDTLYAVVTVDTVPTPNAGGHQTACNGAYFHIGSSKSVSGHNYSWKSNPPGFTSSYDSATVDPSVSTTYYLTETIVATGCAATDSAKITIYPIPVPDTGKDTSVCAGTTLTIGGPAKTGDTYKWIVTGSSAFSTTSNPVISPTKTATYSLYETNSYGCQSYGAMTITVIPKPIARFSFAASCIGDSTTFTDSSNSASYYKWSFGDGTTSTVKNPSHLYAGLGTYNVTLHDSNGIGCTDSVSKTVVFSSCVWPGDANHDKVDNIYDLLPIGIAYNDTGSKRIDTTTQWYAHPCADWSGSFKSGVNHKHADCDGDGIVDSLDIAAIIRNYSKTHSKAGGAITSGNPNDPELSLSISKDSVGTSDTISVQMNLGTSSKMLSNIYGICFTVTYDPVNVGHAKSFSADFSNCWLGKLNKNMIYLVHNDSANGVIDIGITRTDHTNVSGYGAIGKLTIITPDNVGGKKLLHKELLFGIENVKAIDFAEDDISLYTSGDSVLFYGYSGIKPIYATVNNIHLYPNPAHSSLQIDAGKDLISEIEVSDILGRNVLSLKYNHSQKTDLNINSLSPGTYYIYILTDHGFARSRFVKD